MSKKMDPAVARAVELATMPMRDVPLPALFYAKALCDQVGMCGEISAYAVHAQVAEGLICHDDLYVAAPRVREEYAAAQRDYELVGTRIRRKAQP